jgi:2-succinyl-5-enolpyruvyl-6-hydroxy-3-cyclohexene-1-carboxylate synthase
MALALVAHRGIAVQVFHDERSAAFAALGHGLATQRPALVLCSSGTAGAHFYAAVIEADASAVPLIVVTADRPPELWGRGAPQTIDQTHLYGTHVRDFVEPGVAEDLDPTMWRPLARRLWNSATRPIPGPVHANLSFRDPLTGTPGTLPEPIEANEPIASATAGTATIDDLQERLSLTTGVIVAGRSQTDPATILKLAEQLGWPVLADHRSGCRSPRSAVVVRCFDSLLRSPEFTSSHRPNVVLRIGEIVASKSLSQWLSASAAAGTTVLSSRPHGRSIDPESIASIQFDEPGVIAELADRLTGPAADTAWLTSWSDADRIAAVTIDSLVANGSQPSEIAIAQACVRAVPSGGALVLSSSMPVRDVEWFGPNRDDITVIANRGANGIDGVVATALGVALAGQPTVCLIGDVAFLHDSSTLIALQRRTADLTIVVTNNDGGGIFSFLPQHRLLDTADYEALFGTPHGTDLAALVGSHGLAVEDFVDPLPVPSSVRVFLASTDRQSNLDHHGQMHHAVAEALALAQG